MKYTDNIFKCRSCGHLFKVRPLLDSHYIPPQKKIEVLTTIPPDTAVICEKCGGVNDKNDICYWRQFLMLGYWLLIILIPVAILLYFIG
jgi:hypothetical protein